MYKWGMINKQAGTATITLRDQGDRYVSQLVGHSAPWADKFFMVRDTLNGVMDKQGYKPHFYEKIAHEGDDHKHDIVRFTYDGNSVTVNVPEKPLKRPAKTRPQYHPDSRRKNSGYAVVFLLHAHASLRKMETRTERDRDHILRKTKRNPVV